MAETGRYLYAVTRGATDDLLDQVRGLDDAALATVEHDGLVGVVSDVDLDEYGEEGLRRNLERMDWLEKVARRHDEVVHAVAQLGPVAPLRLATICLGDDGVRRRLAEWHDALVAALDRVEGRREWSVKAYAPRVETPQQAPVEPGTTGGGAAYLRRKKEQTLSRAQGEEAALRVAEAVHARLVAHCDASRRLAPQDPRLTGHTGTMTLNSAFLVAVDREQEFVEEVRALQAEHPEAGIDVAGPWPPYSFAVLDQS